MAPPTLVHLPQSPWSEKARWALDHHGVPYRALEHVPMLYEPVLRVMSRELYRKPSVPMLVDGRVVARDSLAIALYAEQRGSGTPLFPRGREGAVRLWSDRSDRLLDAARARLMDRLVANDEALVEALPPPMQRLGKALVPLARLGSSFIIQKYGTRARPPAELEAEITTVLEATDAAIARGDYLAGDGFTFADIAIASAVGMIAPHPRQPLGPASREVWSEPAVAAAFSNVVAWRDRIVEHHR